MRDRLPHGPLRLPPLAPGKLRKSTRNPPRSVESSCRPRDRAAPPAARWRPASVNTRMRRRMTILSPQRNLAAGRAQRHGNAPEQAPVSVSGRGSISLNSDPQRADAGSECGPVFSSRRAKLGIAWSGGRLIPSRSVNKTQGWPGLGHRQRRRGRLDRHRRQLRTVDHGSDPADLPGIRHAGGPGRAGPRPSRR